MPKINLPAPSNGQAKSKNGNSNLADWVNSRWPEVESPDGSKNSTVHDFCGLADDRDGNQTGKENSDGKRNSVTAAHLPHATSQPLDTAGVKCLRNSITKTPLGTDPNLVERVASDIAALGLVGEQSGALLVWLAYTSRKLENPISVIIRGPSGSGKDRVQRIPAQLIPQDDVIDVMSLTGQAFYYGEPGWLKHKVVLGGERSHQDDDAQRDKTAAVRQMLSQHYITKQTVTHQETVAIRQDGPISYSETTTKDSIFSEDLNRCFQINTDASQAHTRKILRAVAASFNQSETARVNQSAIIQQHHEFQISLESVRVSIPYAATLADKMPATKVEVRRIMTQILSVIEVIAFVHQHQRPKENGGCIVSTRADYEIARRLLLEPLQHSLGLGDKFRDLEAAYNRLPKSTFGSTSVLPLFRNCKMTRDRSLKKLEECGLVKRVHKGVGPNPATWERSDKQIDELVLPGVATLFP